MSLSTSTSSVVERASKEISRRMHSLGFKTASNQATPTSTKPKTSDKSKIVLSESDKLNGNNEQPSDQPETASGAVASKAEDGVVRRKKPLCPAAKQPAARASMSSIIKGSVMDKVTHVFNNGVSGMGNTSNKATSGLATASTPTASSDSGGGKGSGAGGGSSKNAEAAKAEAADIMVNNDGGKAAGGGALLSAPAGINIPKGK